MNAIPDGLRASRYFFVALATCAALVVFVGFAPTFYLRGVFQAPALSTLLVVHGIACSAWMVLLIAQTLLIRAANFRAHRALGLAGAVLALLIVALGIAVALDGARRGTSGARFGIPPLEFLIIPLGQILIFAALVTVALSLRRRPAAHKRLMVVATLQLVAPAAVRAAAGLFHIETPLSALVVLGIGVGCCIAYDIARRRRVHPVFGLVAPMTLASFPLRIAFSHSAAWHAAANWLIS